MHQDFQTDTAKCAADIQAESNTAADCLNVQ